MAERRIHALKPVETDLPARTNPKLTFGADVAAIYAENSAVARAIMEWRHKVVMLYVVSVGAAGSCWLWLYEHHGDNKLPLLCYVVGVVAAILGVMDGTNSAILKACYSVGHQAEQRVAGIDGGIFTALHFRSQHPHTITYSRTLRVLFFGTSAVFLILGTVLRIEAIQ